MDTKRYIYIHFLQTVDSYKILIIINKNVTSQINKTLIEKLKIYRCIFFTSTSSGWWMWTKAIGPHQNEYMGPYILKYSREMSQSLSKV